MRGAGVGFQPGYILMDPDTGARSSRLLADEPLYVAGLAAAERWLARGSTREQLLPVFGRTAEYAVLQQIGGPGEVDGTWLTEPILIWEPGSGYEVAE
jgi:hypothetical protein